MSEPLGLFRTLILAWCRMTLRGSLIKFTSTTVELMLNEERLFLIYTGAHHLLLRVSCQYGRQNKSSELYQYKKEKEVLLTLRKSRDLCAA